MKNYQPYEWNTPKQIQPLRTLHREKKTKIKNTEEEIYLNKFTKNIVSRKRKKKNRRNRAGNIFVAADIRLTSHEPRINNDINEANERWEGARRGGRRFDPERNAARRHDAKRIYPLAAINPRIYRDSSAHCSGVK